MTIAQSISPELHGDHTARGVLTTITSLIARSGHEAAIARVFEKAHARDGERSHHLSSMLIQQQNGLSFLISQFRSQSELDAWRASTDYREMIAAFEEHSLRELCTLHEPIVRLVVPSNDSGPKWKVFASSWIVVYPLLLVLSGILDALIPGFPTVFRVAITSFIVSAALIWVISPLLRRMTRTWRLKNQQMRINAVRS